MLKAHWEAVERSLVHNVGADESTSLVALPLSVGSSDNGEASSRRDDFIDSLDQEGLAFEDRLKTHGLRRGLIVLVKKQHSAATGCEGDRTIFPDRLAIFENKRTEKFIFIGHVGDVDAEAFASESRTGLLDHRGLAVARKTSHEHRVETVRSKNRTNIVEVTERNIVRNLRRHSLARNGRHDRDGRIGLSHLNNGSRGSRGWSSHWCRSSRRRRRSLVGSRKHIDASGCSILLVIEQPAGKSHAVFSGDIFHLLASKSRTRPEALSRSSSQEFGSINNFRQG